MVREAGSNSSQAINYLNYGSEFLDDAVRSTEHAYRAESNALKKIENLVGFRRDHILNRHKSGAGKPGKTEFPASWSDEKILEEINKIANDPNALGGIGIYDSPYKVGTVDGVEIRVDFYPRNHSRYSGKVSTAYPTNTHANPQ